MYEDNETRVIHLSQEQLKKRRAEILDIVGLSHKEFVRKIMYDDLQGQEWKYATELDAIDFLLGEDHVED